ncbi:MAG: PD-(D/E)XK nuclease family protein [Bacteroidales bacterium]|nr:PD-(D/E)XK nuclease family protein [Bacteroidales bacterium]
MAVIPVIYPTLLTMNTGSITKPFLKAVAEDLIHRFGINLSSICVVFPNKRARLFFSQYLGETSEGKTVWSPSYRTISELVRELSGLTLADKIQLLFELFSVYKRITGTFENFDDFYYYSEILLSDYEEIDKSLVNARDIFRNLSDQKVIENYFNYLSDNQLIAIRQFWSSFNGKPISKDQKEFIRFWDILYEVYVSFREQLMRKQLAYEGMIYREVAEKLSGTDTVLFPFERYVLVGFNALNACEEILFNHLKNINKAIFYWDYDEYYTRSDAHEAGYFIRGNSRRYKAPDLSVDYSNLTKTNKNIIVLPVSSTTAQAKAIPAVFSMLKLSGENDFRHTALVLPEERLMLPVLYSLPECIRDVNVTMGYPLRESSVFAFIELIYQLYRNSMDHPGDETVFFYKDVIALLKHPFVCSYYKDIVDQLIGNIRKNNRTYVGIKELHQMHELQLFFQPVKSAADSVSCILSMLKYTVCNLLADNKRPINQLQLECIYQAYTGITRLSDILSTSDLTFSAQLFFRLIRKICRGMTVPFAGEPLAGLQILGILETRLLDFENVIVLSMNEGIVPRSLPLSSFIPNNLRFGFGMSVPEHHDAVYAYYFYRLIQRASNVFLMYNESADGLRTGERSRFIHQLANEAPFRIKEIRLETSFAESPVKKIVIEKTQPVLSRLNAYLDEAAECWLSPSAINEYINCPLKFYFHHIASLKETEEVAEAIDPLIFGNLLHVSMYELYKPYVGKDINQDIISGIIKEDNKLESTIISSFHRVLYKTVIPKTNELTGMHTIIKEIIKKYVVQMLKADHSNCPFHLLSLEERYRMSVPLVLQGRKKQVRIGGIIDRIDQYKGAIRIIDYKTGPEKLSFQSLESLFTALPLKRNDAVFQVFLYAYLYKHKFPDAPVIPCLAFLRDSYKPDFSWLLKDQSDRSEVLEFRSYDQPFGEHLKFMLEILFDPSKPFTQTSAEEFCGFCEYRRICHR